MHGNNKGFGMTADGLEQRAQFLFYFDGNARADRGISVKLVGLLNVVTEEAFESCKM